VISNRESNASVRVENSVDLNFANQLTQIPSWIHKGSDSDGGILADKAAIPFIVGSRGTGARIMISACRKS
jgi:hypothetical protein